MIMKTSEKLVRRLYSMGVMESLTPIIRTSHGSRNGSWNWSISDNANDVGSMYSMKECLSFDRLIYSRCLHELFPFYEGVTTVDFGDIVEDSDRGKI